MFGIFISLSLKCVTNSQTFTNQPSWGKHYTLSPFATKDVFMHSIETCPPGGREDWPGVVCRSSSM